MKLWRITFSHDAFYKLPEDTRIFWLQLAQIRNDLRTIDGICIISINAVQQKTGVEQSVGLHQLIFGVRQLCGTLEEAHKMVQKKWHGTGLSKQMSAALSQKAKDGLKAFNKYFNSQNLVTIVRQKFVHHFDSEMLKDRLCNCTPDELHEFVTGRCAGNIFYTFAETLRHQALIRAAGELDLQSAVRKLYDEPRNAVLDPFEAFADDILLKIAENLDLKTEEVTVESPVDPKTIRPFLFFPEQS